MSFYDKTCMQRLETESCLGLTGLGSHNFICSKQKEHPSRHYAQTLWMLKNATFGKKSMQAYYLKKMCKKCYFFFFCKILQFVVIHRCKLWYQLTFL